MDFNIFYSNEWIQIETKLEQEPDSKTKGDLFEYFAYFYLKYFKHLYDINEIYCPVVDGRPFPSKIIEKLNLEVKDSGVDGVYITNKGEFIAWQAKFRGKRVPLTARELSTFWAEAEYADYRLIISNTRKLPTVAGKKSGHLTILVDHFERLESEFFDTLARYFLQEEQDILIKRKQPRDYQDKILEDIREGFANYNKGKVIAACGIGKTLISLWATEEQNARKVIFFAPSLQLIRQTLEEWSKETIRNFKYLCICSDQSVDTSVDQNNISLDEIDIPVTTNSEDILRFLKSNNSDRPVYMFCTYQSAEVIADAVKKHGEWYFDLAIFDEAHRTAGFGVNSQFSLALKDENIPAIKKLFLTATERLVRPSFANSAIEKGIIVYSMNDEQIYGKVFHRLTFGEAIEKRIISDYRIVLSGISSSEYERIIKDNLYLANETSQEEKIEAAQNIYKRFILRKALFEVGIFKVISFHSKISDSKLFARKLAEENIAEPNVNVYINHINGSMSAQDRAMIIKDFEDADIGVISNVRCLTEGVDIPLIDGVFFSDPKGSMIDIVQAVGRALRQKYGEQYKTAYIIIPILLDDSSDEIISGEGFEALYNLIQALRDQDYGLAEWIDTINAAAVRGRIKNEKKLGKIELYMPKHIDYEKFQDSLMLKIADVNRDPTGTTGIGSKLGKKERKGSIVRVFKTIIDYRYDTCQKSLVDPTLLLMDSGKSYNPSEIKINNNNISHCRRLGLIKKLDASYQLTVIGQLLKLGKISFDTIFKNQMLLFREETSGKIIYPYRTAMNFLKELKSINYIQFLYGLYSIQFDNDNRPNLNEAVQNAEKIQAKYPNIHLTSESNKAKVLSELNELCDRDFSFNNVWTDRTTAGNQFRYLIRHLELFDDLFALRDKNITILPGSEKKIEALLANTSSFLNTRDYGNKIWIES
ncbi:DEAD/DEAH box helicase family protein [Maribellus sp. CM-23]|uniref:DEAD/DEAH box helicase family protein n=1 Tax=Maribellus sp. CM-23 TaxID=2781026 RepID=UPI001F1C2E36|nr:DEAD/DEAH box helicase family protein [Maribellus sp. CM-23]MCE4566031.1 DEAD/DEAH box helicase family protein [Maribellus sp. CM-23]